MNQPARVRVFNVDLTTQALALWQSARLKAYHDQFHPEHGQSHGTRLILGDSTEDIGQFAQMAFAKLYNLPIDTTIYRGGDGRVDFEINDRTVDVKGGSWNYGLARRVDKLHAELLVFGVVTFEISQVCFMGWEFDEEIVKRPPERIKKDGPLNHVCPSDELRPMHQLETYLALEATP